MNIMRRDSVFSRCEIAPVPATMRLNVKAFIQPKSIKESIMWIKPEVTEMRFGFEVTMYVCNR